MAELVSEPGSLSVQEGDLLKSVPRAVQWYKCDRMMFNEDASSAFTQQWLRGESPYNSCVRSTDMSVECDRVWHTKTLGPLILRRSEASADRDYRPCLPYYPPLVTADDAPDALRNPEAAYRVLNERDPDMRHRMQRWANQEPLSREAEEVYGRDGGPGGGTDQVQCQKGKAAEKCTLQRRRRRDEGGVDETGKHHRRGERWEQYRDKTDGWIIEPIMVTGRLIPGGARGNPVTIICVRAEFKCDPKVERRYGKLPTGRALGEPDEEYMKRMERSVQYSWSVGSWSAVAGDGCVRAGRAQSCACERCGAKRRIVNDATWSLVVATGDRAGALDAFWQMALVLDRLLHTAAESPGAFQPSPARSSGR